MGYYPKTDKDTVLGMQTCSKWKEKLAQIKSVGQRALEGNARRTKKVDNNKNSNNNNNLTPAEIYVWAPKES